MANYKDINADLGTQTIEGTSPPDAVEAEIVMPDGSSRPIPTASDLDAQLAALMAESEPESNSDSTIFAMPAADSDPDDLDAQLAALMSESSDEPKYTQAELDAIDAKIDAILDGTKPGDTETADRPRQDEPDEQPIILSAPATDDHSQATDEQPIILSAPASDNAIFDTPSDLVPEQVEQQTEQQQSAASDDSESTVQENIQEQNSEDPAAAAVTPDTSDNDRQRAKEADEARAMLEQAMQLMAQAQAAQQQAREEMEAAKQAAQSAPKPEDSDIIRQAQAMLRQAQEAQQQAQLAAQEAQLQAQAVHAQTAAPSGYVHQTDPYGSAREVDRLKSELDGMRDLVNKLTLTISQIPGGAQQIAQMPMFYAQQQSQRRDGEDREQYHKLETELERMRREILEKDLRDREKELERKQKEAENTVKDIRPEMIQMSDSRDIAPMGGMNNQSAPGGGEYIPLANGVYYSIRDKQVYVMTPAANAAAASPTIEPKRPAPRPAPKKRAAPPRRRPSGIHHRRPAPRRPSRPHR